MDVKNPVQAGPVDEGVQRASAADGQVVGDVEIPGDGRILASSGYAERVGAGWHVNAIGTCQGIGLLDGRTQGDLVAGGGQIDVHASVAQRRCINSVVEIVDRERGQQQSTLQRLDAEPSQMCEAAGSAMTSS